MMRSNKTPDLDKLRARLGVLEADMHVAQATEQAAYREHDRLRNTLPRTHQLNKDIEKAAQLLKDTARKRSEKEEAFSLARELERHVCDLGDIHDRVNKAFPNGLPDDEGSLRIELRHLAVDRLVADDMVQRATYVLAESERAEARGRPDRLRQQRLLRLAEHERLRRNDTTSKYRETLERLRLLNEHRETEREAGEAVERLVPKLKEAKVL